MKTGEKVFLGLVSARPHYLGQRGTTVNVKDQHQTHTDERRPAQHHHTHRYTGTHKIPIREL